MQVGVDVEGEGCALSAAAVDEHLLPADREEVEVRQPERGDHNQREYRGDDHTGAECGAPRAEADRDQRLADRNDHDQPMTLDEVRGLHAPAAHVGQERTEEADGNRSHPEHRPERAVDEPRGEDQRCAAERHRRNSQDRRQQVVVTASRERIQREKHDVHDQKSNPEHNTVPPERIGHGQRGHEHRSHRNQHRPPDRADIRVDRVRQPGEGRPGPPERSEDQEPVPEPTPCRIIRQQRCHLSEPEDEDEVEEQLERRNPLLVLSLVLAHGRTLARRLRDRPRTTAVQPPR